MKTVNVYDSKDKPEVITEDSRGMVQFAYVLNMRVVEGPKAQLLRELAKAYKTDVGCRLVWRILKDSQGIILERKRREAELAEREKQLAEEKKHLYGGT